MKIKMFPDIATLGKGESGIHTVVRQYAKHLPKQGIEFVSHDSKDKFDLAVVHAGMVTSVPKHVPLVAMTHGLYWTADHLSPRWEYGANRNVITSIRSAKEVTVPSTWVAKVFQRDMRFTPHVIHHGVDVQDWTCNEKGNYVIAYGKNRADSDVCDPSFVSDLARAFPRVTFYATFAPPDAPSNVIVTGLLPHDRMKKMIEGALVVISPIKETFGIMTLEAMAAGCAILGYAEGGNLDLVQHGVNGYLARPDNFADFKNGLSYCLVNAEGLGDNSREISQQFTWEKVAEKVRTVFDKAVEPDSPTVGIVIPYYNKPLEMLQRAIDSAINQTRRPDSITVVDDCSVNPIPEDFMLKNPRAYFVRLERNSGVAIARNMGIELTKTKYITCLDADDAIAPEFVEACVNALEENNDLHLAYTRLRWIKPDGSEGISQWPGDWNYDDFFVRKNQVPTCNMYRRKTWERLGGYKARYCPTGAGSEDAEFWLRFGAYGYRCALVDERPLFIYSWMSGHTSQQGYSETPWLTLHPWAVDNQHPFASYATPNNKLSHPVRQYDEPLISVIIPVGKGHEQRIINALDSLESQTFRQWEAIVVWDTPSIPDNILKAYPYTLINHGDIQFGVLTSFGMREAGQPAGAGFARNLGVKYSKGKLLLFLDADDNLAPNALQRMLEAWEENQKIVYTDYVGKVYTDTPDELIAQVNQDPYRQVLKRDGDKLWIHHDASREFDCERAQRQPEDGKQPYLWCLVTTLLPRKWHDDIGGFDESLLSFEDVDYHWRLARAGKCYIRIAEDLVVYRYYSGTRRSTGLQNRRDLLEYLKNKYKQETAMPCGCRGNTVKEKDVSQRIAQFIASAEGEAGNMQVFNTVNGTVQVNDSELIKARYTDPKQGAHLVVGNNSKIKYGRRRSGDVFLVHVSDLGYKTANGNFVPSSQFVALTNAVVPQAEITPPPAPTRLVKKSVVEADAKSSEVSQDSEPAPVAAKLDLSAPFDFTEINGIGKATAKRLNQQGIVSLNDLIIFGESGLKTISGISAEKAHDVYYEALKLTA